VIAYLGFASTTVQAASTDEKPAADNRAAVSTAERPLYHLGPGDEIRVQQPYAEELDGKIARIDDAGFATLPLVGKVKVGGLTVEQAESQLTSRLSELLLHPEPIISIVEYRSQPVSVVGAVNNPGVIQLQGSKTLLEMLSLAGGLRQDAGSEVEITRHLANGRVPVGKEKLDPSGEFSTATIDLTKLMNGTSPGANILISPNDVITVPRAELIYVTGDVKKPGGFPLNSGAGISVLQAVSLAEGLGPQAAPKNAKIFRLRGEGPEKDEIPVDVARIQAAKSADVTLKAGDILFVPDSTSKKAGIRAAEAAIQTITGVVIWRR
jgi:polysaccharide export outer membrane protein